MSEYFALFKIIRNRIINVYTKNGFILITRFLHVARFQKVDGRRSTIHLLLVDRTPDGPRFDRSTMTTTMTNNWPSFSLFTLVIGYARASKRRLISERGAVTWTRGLLSAGKKRGRAYICLLAGQSFGVVTWARNLRLDDAVAEEIFGGSRQRIPLA